MNRMLIVAGLTADPTEIVDALRKKVEAEDRIEATVLVPASLHGLEWLGDPRATVPAAERYAAVLQVALLNLGVARCEARVGDPDSHAAIDDALADEEFDEVVISMRSSRVASVLGIGVADRVAAASDATVTRLRPAHRRRTRGNGLIPAVAESG
jgi:hypothetical protein